MHTAISFLSHGEQSPAVQEVVKKLIWGGAGGITLLELFTLEAGEFEQIKAEVEKILAQPGQELDGSHPTTKYVAKQDPGWKPKPGGVQQYSLYNSGNSFLYNEDDHHWTPVNRQFNSQLFRIPGFIDRHFPGSELQNCRLNALTKDGGLGQHREKIIGIPGRVNDYKLRFHLPIITNPKVIFYMDLQEHRMEAGRVYLFNQSSMHGVNNAGEALRAHLVFDLYLNPFIVSEIIIPALNR